MQALAERCRQVTQQLARAEGWPLPPAGIAALTEAVLPYVRDLEPATPLQIQRVVHNYYLDGPMVQQMGMAGSADGERLWTEWREYMLALAQARGLALDQAEELAHEVYLQTQKALPSYRFGSRLKTYFCGIFINCYRHWSRARRRSAQREQALAEDGLAGGEAGAPLVAGDTSSPEAQAVARQQRQQMRVLVQERLRRIVSSEDFKILYWYYVEKTFVDGETQQVLKWTDKVISAQLDMPLNTVTSRRLRALKRLRENQELRGAFAAIVDLG